MPKCHSETVGAAGGYTYIIIFMEFLQFLRASHIATSFSCLQTSFRITGLYHTQNATSILSPLCSVEEVTHQTTMQTQV